MKKALIAPHEGNRICEIRADDFPVAPPLKWVDCANDVGMDWTYNGTEFLPPAVHVPTPEEMRAAFTDAVQQHIDAVARARGYDSGISCASYFNDQHPPFNDDAQAFVPWRSSVWLYCYAEFDKLMAGQREIIPLEQFITELPDAPWSIA